MADVPPNPNSDIGGNARMRPDRRSPPGIPRWVKASALIAIALVVLFVIMHLAGGGFGHHAPLMQYWAQ